ncbi:MAG: cell division protein FtsK, partial [Pseudonocardia sp.]
MHLAGYHATRLPLYAARVGWRAPAGVVVGMVALLGWVLDFEGAPLRRAAAQKTNTAEYLALCRQRRDRVRPRATGTA